MATRHVDSRPLRIGISSCLLGDEVRFDGGHKHDRFLTDTLGPFVEWVRVCPEVELGLGIPRESIHLEDQGGTIRLVGTRSHTDHTDGMRSYAAARVEKLAREDLCGYVLKKNSPSCGLERVKIHRKGGSARNGRGLFAEALIQRFPNLPVEEEGRLCDPRLRENWIERIFAYRALRDLFSGRWTIGNLVAFHTAQKLTLLAHSPKAYATLGRLVAKAKTLDRDVLREQYENGFMDAMRRVATTARHTNVLSHMAGYFRKHLDDASRQELREHIEDYRRGLVPLVVPLTLVRHHARRLDVTYLLGQAYLAPHPKELALRNHV